MLQAYNKIVYTQSPTVTIVLAAVPSKPSTSPTKDFAQTTSSKIKVVYIGLPSSQNRISAILDYDLWRDDCNSGLYDSGGSRNCFHKLQCRDGLDIQIPIQDKEHQRMEWFLK